MAEDQSDRVWVACATYGVALVERGASREFDGGGEDEEGGADEGEEEEGGWGAV